MRLEKISLMLTILSLLLVVVQTGVVSANTTVAVMPFEGHEIRQWYIDRQQMISGITESLTDRLVELEDVRVVERNRLHEIIDEQDFGQTERVDTFTAAEIGRIAGADLLIMGSVTTIEVKESGGIRIGPFSASGSSATVDLSIRVVDTRTGELVGSASSSGKKTGASIGVQNLYGVSFKSEAFKNSVLGQAVNEAIDQLLDEIEEKFVGWVHYEEGPTGQILAIVGDRYVINLGKDHEIGRGDRFAVYQLVNIEGVADPVKIPEGTLRVISVDAGVSVAEAEEGRMFDVGYAVQKQ